MATYIGGRKGTVLQWVDLRPIFEVYVWEKRFKGGGRWRKMWWWQEVLGEVLRVKLLEASREVRLRNRWRDTPQEAAESVRGRE